MATDEELTADELEQREDLVASDQDAEAVVGATDPEQPPEVDAADFYEQTRDLPGEDEEDERA